ncbi:MAG: hypothetical protein AAF766_23205 [Cyanobacteria bacterium P01_D01_bin.14]
MPFESTRAPLHHLYQLLHDQAAIPEEKDSLRNQLRLLKEAELLVDQRTRTQGATNWHFSIDLASRASKLENDEAILRAIAPLRGRPWSRRAVETACLDVAQAFYRKQTKEAQV